MNWPAHDRRQILSLVVSLAVFALAVAAGTCCSIWGWP